MWERPTEDEIKEKFFIRSKFVPDFHPNTKDFGLSDNFGSTPEYTPTGMSLNSSRDYRNLPKEVPMYTLTEGDWSAELFVNTGYPKYELPEPDQSPDIKDKVAFIKYIKQQGAVSVKFNEIHDEVRIISGVEATTGDIERWHDPEFVERVATLMYYFFTNYNLSRNGQRKAMTVVFSPPEVPIEFHIAYRFALTGAHTDPNLVRDL